MEELFARLADLLERQRAVIDRLIELGREETRALRDEDVACLGRLVAEQQVFSEELGRLEKERMELEEELARRVGQPGAAPMRQILCLAGPRQEELARLTAHLRSSYVRLKELNGTNRLLIQQALAYVNQVLSACGAQTPVYDHQGRIRARDDRVALNTVV